MSEEEAKKYLTNIKDDIFIHLKNHGWIYDINRIIDVDNAIIAIETVLNMLEDNKQRIRRLCKESNQLFNEKEKLGKEVAETKANEYKCDSIIGELLDEIEKKDKIIDLMAEKISVKTCPHEDYDFDINCRNRCSNDNNLSKRCWKRYFEEKVENEEMEL